ncbi:glycosyltransferase, activator-dependent family [Sinosporangium album]|uniref:Glycosyltransferase, activator-dependent family n=1 Tax=Sinosporangium album TaxID=504805 RepID=A0A1G7ZCK7_9ACTN|nr:glycosyltransferase, activator-dependent family [Sinosporangium album]
MRVLIATQAERTHFLGMVPLAWALRTAGHDVVVASQPELTEVVGGAGLTFVPVGTDHRFRHVIKRGAAAPEPDFDMTGLRPDRVTWEYLRDGYRQIVPWWWRMVNEPMLGDLIALCRGWRPDLVIWEPTTFAGAIAAEASGAVHARFLWSVDLFAGMRGHYLRLMHEQPAGRREDPLADWIGTRVAAFGGEFSETLTRGHFTIDYMPDSLRLDVPLRYAAMCYVPYNGRAVVPEWLRRPSQRPRVCLTLGTTAHERFGRYAVSVPDLIEAVGDVDAEVVVTLPRAQQESLPRVPDNIRLVDFAPLHAVLPTCAAIVNQGGPGTVFTTLSYGVPQLILPNPHMFDAPLLARRVAEQGAGLTVASADVTPEVVREGLLTVLADPGFRRHTNRIRDEMRGLPTPNALVPEIEGLAAHYRRPVVTQ